jgi:CRISPR/Cas system-associated protein Cas7 (RAMP superfamily)
MLSGKFGAAASRALPIVRVVELICAVSGQPIPNLVHGFYSDYAEESAKILKTVHSMNKQLKVFAYGDRIADILKRSLPEDVLTVEDSVYTALMNTARVTEEWLK